MKKQITKRITNLFKIRSIVTLSFVVIIFLTVLKQLELPEWLVTIVVLCFKELFDKDKVNTNVEEDE